MADPYGLELSGLDPETTAELRRLKRQELMADELAKRGMQPLQGQMVGGVYVRPSIFQGLSGLAQSWLAKDERDKIDEGYKALGEKRKAVEDAAFAKYRENTVGTPEIPIPEDGIGPGRPAMPATPEQRRTAIQDAIMGNNPRLARMATLEMQQDWRKEDKAAAAQSRLDQINAAEKEKRITKEEADVRRAEEAAIARRENAANREALARLYAGLKQQTSNPKAAKDFKWNEDGTEQVVIPGSATDLKMKAAKTKDDRNKELLDATLDAEIANIDKLIGNEGKKIKEHKGLNRATGVFLGRDWMPTLSEDTSNAEALIKSLQSKASISSLQTIRGTSGAIGSLTEKEWPRLESMKATLQTTQGTPQYRESLKEYRKELERIKRLGAESVSDTSGVSVPSNNGRGQNSSDDKKIVREEQLKDGRIGVEYEDGSRGYK